MTPLRPSFLLPLTALLVLAGWSVVGQRAAAQTVQPQQAGQHSITLPALPSSHPTPLSTVQKAGIDAVLGRVQGFRAGVLIADAESGQSLYARQADALFTPASNMKLLSLGTALYTLGPDYWFSTSVTRPAGSGASPAHLTLVGSGDPSLGDTPGHSLAGLARQVYASGVRRAGSLRLDARLIGAAAGHGEAGWSVPVVERPVSGLTLNDPTAGDGAELTTTPDTRAALQRLGRQFRAELTRAGVQVGTGLEISSGTVSEQAPAIAAAAPEEGVATTRSLPLARLALSALKRSDNVWTEQLYARLGVNTGTPVWRPASPRHARTQELTLLGQAGASGSGLVLADGSGLSEQNRLTPRALVLLLRYVYLHPPGSAETLTPLAAFAQRRNLLIEALPRAGTGTESKEDALLGGTLATRLSGLDVRAKTGTLPGVSALSGYLQTRSGRVLVFSVLMDGYSGPGQHLRQLQDALLRALAADRPASP